MTPSDVKTLQLGRKQAWSEGMKYLRLGALASASFASRFASGHFAWVVES